MVCVFFFRAGEVRSIERTFIMAVWEQCYSKTLKFEGGFQKNYQDKGNWTGGKIGAGELRGTKYGISAASYPNVDIASLTQEQAIEIYRRDYWDALKLSSITSNRIAWKIFDIAVNCGRMTAAKMLQESVGVVADGLIGNITLQAVNNADIVKLMNDIVTQQQKHYEEIHNENNDWAFRGWMLRAEETAPELA